MIDSGASESVMPIEWCQHVILRETQASRQGRNYTVANGDPIYNKGEKLVTMMTREGCNRNMGFQVCDVARPLGVVSQFCRTGHSVVFNPPEHSEGSFILHHLTGDKMHLKEEGGVYWLNTMVAPKEKQATPFVGQGR